MTRQELFDKAYVGLKAQGFRQSINGQGRCLYRGNDVKCAIGHCIPDEKYEAAFDEGVIHSLEDILGIIGYNDDSEFAYELREIHDNCSTPSHMNACLVEFAHEQDLTVPEAA